MISLSSESAQVYLVGGAVRDKLLGRTVKERDWVVVGSSPEELLSIGFISVGKDFPVFIHPQSHEEYALARTERKSGKGYKGFLFHTASDVSLEQDLKRRDLTINAIAEDQQGNVIDPFSGRDDLRHRILRHVSPAFVEDPLRVLRLARFTATLGFRIADETIALARKLVRSGELGYLTPERIWNETEKAMSGDYPVRYILSLKRLGALEIILPEIARLFGVPQSKTYHPEIDVGVHTMMCLHQASRLSKDPSVRFATLLHDIGKGTTPQTSWPEHPQHEDRGAKMVKLLCERLCVPKKYADLAYCVAKFHGACHQIKQMSASAILQTLQKLDAFRRPQRFNQFLLACEADAHGRAGLSADYDYSQARYLKLAYLMAQKVSAREFLDRGLSGLELGEEISRHQVRAISKLKETTTSL